MINKKGGLSVLSMLSFVFITLAITTGVGFMIGYANQEYGATFNTNISGTDLTQEGSFSTFIDATNVYNETNVSGVYSINDTSILSASDTIQTALSGSGDMLSSIIDITPLEEYGGFLKTLLALIITILVIMLAIQLVFNRSLI